MSHAPTPFAPLMPTDASAAPSGLWRMLSLRGVKGRRLPKGLDAAYDKLLGLFVPLSPRRARFMKRAQRVLAMEANYADLSEARLRDEAASLREMFRRGRHRKRDVERAFAIVREVAWRKLSMRHYREQVAAAFALEAGCVAEMATGEGKTLMATLAATVFGWRGRGCHVITVNDYLAKRDAEWMGPIYKFCGLTCAHIDGPMSPLDRREAYNADITYTTNKEVAADFLRDRLALGKLTGLPSALIHKIAWGAGKGVDRLVQRGLEYAIVDEADSVLIDEAVTPLIISGDSPNPEQTTAYVQAAAAATHLDPKRDYKVNHRYREVVLTASGKHKAFDLTERLGGLWAGARRREELITQAVTARELFKRDSQYVLQFDETEERDKVVIVDESTGRLMPDRTWRDGLHQAVEAKEQIDVTPPKATLARISFQRFFRLYRRLSGMTGTAKESHREMWQIYRMPTVIIPTHRKCIRRHHRDRIFVTMQAKWDAVVEAIANEHETGRPVLVGTRSVETSEYLSKRLTELKLEHRVLNAVRHAEEASIVAEGGLAGKITVATNMAGRGTDIKLGKRVADLGGLAVISTEHNDAGRVDRQLYGRAGRQGDPGSAITYASLDDELLRRYAPRWAKFIARRLRLGRGQLNGPRARRLFDAAQKRAQRLSLRQRKAVLRADDWLDEFLGFAGREV